MSNYDRVAELIGRIRNARFGEQVKYTEELIESGAWRDFETPVGTHFKFEAWEFDYFVAAAGLDPTVIRWAYLKADDVDDLAKKRMRLADITGRGESWRNGDRRDIEDVARAYDSDPSGAGALIRKIKNVQVVTDRDAKIASDPKRRRALESGKKIGRTEPDRKRWMVEWRDDRPPAEVIADKLLADPDLARDVYKRLHSWSVGNAAKKKRRSDD